MDSEFIRKILSNKFGHFEKLRLNPLIKLLISGLANYDGEKWARHRRIVNPAFHVEKLKDLVVAMKKESAYFNSRESKLDVGRACALVWMDGRTEEVPGSNGPTVSSLDLRLPGVDRMGASDGPTISSLDPRFPGVDQMGASDGLTVSSLDPRLSGFDRIDDRMRGWTG